MSVANKNIDYLLSKVAILPNKPGVYKYFNAKGEIIYVGKARNLKKRVSSYFSNKANISFKVKVLVNSIADIEFVVVDTESDALLLENSLIKSHQPRYNVLLKDDKTFPWICIKKETFPRIFYTRNIIKDGSEFFGPFTSVVMVKALMDLVHKIYKLRTCNYVLNDENIKAKKYKVCLEYHLENCLGPCEGLQNQKDYIKDVDEIRSIIKGNLGGVILNLKNLMKEFADKLDFESANAIKEKIDILKNYQSKSTVVNHKINEVEIYAYVDDEKSAYINFLKVSKGAIVQTHTVEIVKRLDESPEEIMSYVIADIRERINTFSKEVIVPFKVDLFNDNIKVTVPQKGDKLHLLGLAERNAKYFKLEKFKRVENAKKTNKKNNILEKAKDDLKLSELPIHIECFDNSNIQGSNPVAACVVFKNGVPKKSEYRHFNVKTVVGPDDFASMYEIVYRRYKRMLDEVTTLPNLVVIDGGKGQLSAATKALKDLDILDKLPIIGIAKKLEEIYFPGDSVPIYMDKNSTTLKLIQNLRNEAHRFGITFHRSKRSSDMMLSELDNIKGIGEKTKDALLKKFGSIASIKNVKLDELIAVVGNNKAKIVYDYFKKN